MDTLRGVADVLLSFRGREIGAPEVAFLRQLIAAHPAVDAVVFLGVGIQSNQASLIRQGRFYPDHGLDRIVAFH